MQRKNDPEIMDDFSIRDERIDQALRELKTINILLGGRGTTRKGFRLLTKNKSLSGRLTVLDAGAGGADVFGNDNEPYAVTALDKNPRACSFLHEHSQHTVVCGDAVNIPFKEKSFDIVHVSLFLHHFREEEIVLLMQSFMRVARRGIIINDLRRSALALFGIKILTILFSRSGMVQHDAPLSVQRGFTRSELLRILSLCSIQKFTLQRTWAFRWLVVVEL
jgi:SAM-dependent methyltransferase